MTRDSPRRLSAAPDRDAPAVHAAIAAVRRGDREAFADVIALCQRRLFGLVLMMTRDPSGAEEVVQDAFVRAFEHLDAYDDQRPFAPWLSTIAVRLAQNWLVRRARIHTREGAVLDQDRDARASRVSPPHPCAPRATAIAPCGSGRAPASQWSWVHARTDWWPQGAKPI